MITFRGLSKKDNKWVYGDLWRKPQRYGSQCLIYVADGDEEEDDTGWVEVYHHTVGQLHNQLTRKANRDVYVGDIIEYDLMEGLGLPFRGGLKEEVTSIENGYYWYVNIRVLGNIHGSK